MLYTDRDYNDRYAFNVHTAVHTDGMLEALFGDDLEELRVAVVSQENLTRFASAYHHSSVNDRLECLIADNWDKVGGWGEYDLYIDRDMNSDTYRTRYYAHHMRFPTNGNQIVNAARLGLLEGDLNELMINLLSNFVDACEGEIKAPVSDFTKRNHLLLTEDHIGNIFIDRAIYIPEDGSIEGTEDDCVTKNLDSVWTATHMQYHLNGICMVNARQALYDEFGQSEETLANYYEYSNTDDWLSDVSPRDMSQCIIDAAKATNTESEIPELLHVFFEEEAIQQRIFMNYMKEKAVRPMTRALYTWALSVFNDEERISSNLLHFV